MDNVEVVNRWIWGGGRTFDWDFKFFIKVVAAMDQPHSLRPIPYACAQPYHQGNGNHGQLCHPC